MATIEVDFDVYKALTARRESESTTYNQVIRDLLNLGATTGRPASKPPVTAAGKGIVLKGVEFPEGTLFRATYKGKGYTGEIKGGTWIDSKGKPHTSPSEAAFSITGSGINGWRFWECSRPNNPEWMLIDNLR